VPTFDTPNDFNVYVSSRLSWDPSLVIEQLWKEWASARYGMDAPRAIAALKRTASISEGIFFVRGFSLLTHLNMVPHLATIDEELKNSYLLQFFPEHEGYRRRHKELSEPSEATIERVLSEKQRAIDEAQRARSDASGIPTLDQWFRKAANAARLWKQIAAVYFRLRQQPILEAQVDSALESLLDEAYRIEREDGRVWPIFPAARGVPVYEFARQALERGKNADDALGVWAQLIKAVRPGAPDFYRTFEIPALPGDAEISFSSGDLRVNGTRLPLGRIVTGTSWKAARPARVTVIPVSEDRFEIHIRNKP
jgi:hypothetical protein